MPFNNIPNSLSTQREQTCLSYKYNKFAHKHCSPKIINYYSHITNSLQFITTQNKWYYPWRWLHQMTINHQLSCIQNHSTHQRLLDSHITNSIQLITTQNKWYYPWRWLHQMTINHKLSCIHNHSTHQRLLHSHITNSIQFISTQNKWYYPWR